MWKTIRKYLQFIIVAAVAFGKEKNPTWSGAQYHGFWSLAPKYVLVSSMGPMCSATPMISMIHKYEFLLSNSDQMRESIKKL